MATSRQEMIEEIAEDLESQITAADRRAWMIEAAAEDLEAERCYADMLAHPESVVDAFGLF
jgi:hypothetical protein